MKALGEVIKLEYGKPLPKEDRDNAGRYPAYGANGEKCKTNRYYWDKPSIIVGRKGSAGEIRLSSDRFWPLDVTYFVTFDDSEYDLIFLYHCLESLQLTKLAKGVKPGINRNEVYQIEFCFPPLAEQKRIVGVLDEAFAAIGVAQANARKNLANARELFETTLNNIFTQKGEGWVETTLGEASENLDKIRVPITKSKRVSGSIPYYGASGVVDYVAEHIFDEDLLLVSEDGANLLARTYPIAFSISGKTWVNNHAHVLRFEKPVSQNFIEFYLNSISLEPYVSGMAQPKLNQKMLNSIPVPWPSIEFQSKVVSKLVSLSKETQRLEAIYQQKLDDLAELKQSILQKAFAGELTSEMEAIAVDTTTPEFTANVICLAHARHAREQRDKTFGRVKAQKDLHLSESIGGVDLGRVATKGNFGPNDSAHMRLAENWAKEQQFFEFVQRPDGRGYDFKKLARYDHMKAKAFAMLKPWREQLDKATDLLINKDTKAAEVFTTVHAAWNNLIIDGAEITDDAILYEARENWHADKMKIDKSKFETAIGEIKRRKIIPDGSAKYVGKRQEDLL